MKKVIFFGSILLFSMSSIAFAQVPNPVIENEIRDVNSIRRRTIELERVKRNANDPAPKASTKEQEIKFAKVKEDFENIQKLQSSIINAYTTGDKIDYKKISELAAEMSKRSVRLDLNLFYSKSDGNDKGETVKNVKPNSVKDLIVELDKVIGIFVSSPIFKNIRLVDGEVSEKSRLDLEKIVKLSYMLSREAKKMK